MSLRNGVPTDSAEVATGVFHDGVIARQAIHSLLELGFSAGQIGAAFRPATPSSASRLNASSAQDSSEWFGHLRGIFREQPSPASTAEWIECDFDRLFADLMVPADQAQRLARELGPDAAIVIVNAGPRRNEAQRVLDAMGANLYPKAEEIAAAQTTAAAPVVSSKPAVASPSKPDHIQLYGEVLRVHKEKVSSGDVRVRKEAVTHLETVQVPVTREHLVVEQADGSGHVDEGNTIHVPLTEERVHIEKETVLRDEYRVGKREIADTETVSGEVRRERLLVDAADLDKHA